MKVLDKYILKNPKIYGEITSMLNENNMEDFLKIYELFVKHKDNEKFENIKVKTLIMTGEFDSGSTPEMSKNLSKYIKNSMVKIIKNGKQVGKVTSAVYSPRLKKNIALAMIQVNFSEIGTELEVATHEGKYTSQIVEKPFYDPKKKIAIS